MSNIIYSDLPPAPDGLSSVDMTRLRGTLPEDVLQTLLRYVQNTGAGATSPTSFGATGDGTTDDTDAIQEALDVAASSNGAVILPAGTYRITSTLEISDVYGFSLLGLARDLTTLEWHGSSGVPMIKIKNSQHVNLERFRMVGNTAGGSRPSAFIESVSDTSYMRTYVPTSNVFRDLLLGTGSANEASYGIKYTNTGTASDTNNSEGSFENLVIQGVTEACLYLGHSQAKAHHLRGCGFTSAKYGVQQVNGSFTWHGGNVSNMSTAAFALGSACDSILISACMSETCDRFLTVGPAGNSWPITMLNCRISGDAVNADKRMVLIGTHGPNRILGCIFDAAAIKIATNWQTAGGSMHVSDCSFAWTSSNVATVLEHANQVGEFHGRGNVYLDASDLAYVRDSEVVSSTATVHGSEKAMLELNSTTKGFLPPRMTSTQRDAIASPPAGLVIYNTTTNKLNVYTTGWEAVTSA